MDTGQATESGAHDVDADTSRERATGSGAKHPDCVVSRRECRAFCWSPVCRPEGGDDHG